MRQLIIILILGSSFGNHALPQMLSLGFRGGLGTYSMSELKSINDAIYTPFKSKHVSDFPPYYFYQPCFILKMNAYSLGMIYTFQSTGSRISARDYSGEYRFDMRIHSNNLGIYNAIQVLSRGNNQLAVYAQAGMAFSNLKIIEYLTVLDTVLTDETIAFKSLNYYLEPGLEYNYRISPSISVGILAGYCIQLGDQPFHLDESKEDKLINPFTGDPVKPNWTGLRFGISFSYVLDPNQKSSRSTQDQQ